MRATSVDYYSFLMSGQLPMTIEYFGCARGVVYERGFLAFHIRYGRWSKLLKCQTRGDDRI